MEVCPACTVLFLSRFNRTLYCIWHFWTCGVALVKVYSAWLF